MKKLISCILICGLLAGTVLCCAGCIDIKLKKKTEPDGQSAAEGDGPGEETEANGSTQAVTDENGISLQPTNAEGERLTIPDYPDINGVPAPGEGGAAATTEPGAEDTAPALTISASRNKGLKVGDTFDVTVGLKNAEKLATVTIHLNYDANYLRVDEVNAESIDELVSVSKDTGAFVNFAAYTAKTLDIQNSPLFTVTFTVLKKPSGSPITYTTANVFSWDVGTDTDGSSTFSITGTVPAVETAIHIDG